MPSRITGVSIESFVQAQIKENTKLNVTGFVRGIHRVQWDSDSKLWFSSSVMETNEYIDKAA